MPSASLASQSNLTEAMSHLTASQIAAQAAFQHRIDTQNQNQADPNHNRKRSETVPPLATAQDVRRTSKTYSPPIPQTQHVPHPGSAVTEQQYRNGLIGNTAATTAAAAAFPRLVHVPTEEKEKDSKKGLKRFRPKNIGISRDKDRDGEKPLPSPNKIQHSGLSQVINASTTSLADTVSSNNSSMYMLNINPSTSTVLNVGDKPEKEKSHKHTLRQKLKLKDKDDYKSLALSSASSNSRPADINNPQSLYTFAPSSPGPSSSFSKSVSGLDLRHGGRALREKKKEEKAQAAALEPAISRGESETSEWPGLGSSITHASTNSFMPYANESLAGFGLNNMTADDAWDFLKAKILVIFEGEDVRIPVEDLNKLVTIHIQQCVHKRDPSIIVGDLEDLLKTGFLSLNHTIRSVPDDRLIPHLVGMWMQVFGTILPFIQAVFLPLDLEFKGRGSILTTPKLAADFWGNLPSAETGSVFSTSASAGGDFDAIVSAGEELEVRRIVLIAFRDTVITPRFEMLKATFSRLSLESINVTLSHLGEGGRTRGNSGGSVGDRPGTAASLDPNNASYSSQSSTLLGSAAASSGARSRATSNLSNGSNPAQEVAFQSFSSPPATRAQDVDSRQVTETVGRMLQCLCVLCSVQSGDASQEKLEELSRQLKLNWLGRGRTGRNRKGFVGSRVRPMRSMGSTIRQAVQGSREGSPTPTPTRQGTVSRAPEVGVAA